MMDLTRAGDVIRSLTMKAFFPLFCVAAIYFALCCLLAAGMNVLIDKTDLERRPRTIKGGGPVSFIEVRHLRKEYTNVVPLKDVNATVERGEVISIIGPSGTGKPTILRCLNRLETPTSGHILVDGVDICDPATDLPAMRCKMGMV